MNLDFNSELDLEYLLEHHKQLEDFLEELDEDVAIFIKFLLYKLGKLDDFRG